MTRTMKLLRPSMISERMIGNESPGTGGKSGNANGGKKMTDEQLAQCGRPLGVARLRHLRGMRLEYRRTSQLPPDNWVGIMYRRNGDSFLQSGIGMFKDGEWLNDKRQPLPEGEWLWVEMVRE